MQQFNNILTSMASKHPTIFTPFADRFDVRFFGKDSNLQTDADLAAVLHDTHIASLHQEHGPEVVLVREPSNRNEHADASMTDERNLWLSIRAADCQQFVVYSPEAHICAVIHAGWKGLKAGMIPALFRRLDAQWGISPESTFVYAGPSLCRACAEFTDPTTELAGLDTAFFHGRHADLRGIADAQLADIGVPQKQMERSPDCTKCMSNVYWSYRGGDQAEVKEGWCNVLCCKLN